MKTLCSFSTVDAAEGRTGEVLERTEAGFFLASNTLYPPGTALTLIVTEPGTRFPVRLRGDVAWARTTDRSGMYVTLAIAPADAAAPDDELRTAASPGRHPQSRA